LEAKQTKTNTPTEIALVEVCFAPQLQRHVPCPDQSVPEGSLSTVLEAAFYAAPLMRRYVLDDQGAIRKHVAVFIGDQLHRTRDDLSVFIPKGTKIHIIQALSGG
jgi:sulfur-carrier protein